MDVAIVLFDDGAYARHATIANFDCVKIKDLMQFVVFWKMFF